MPTRFKDYEYDPFPYQDKIQELVGQQPQWQPRSEDQLLGQASQFAGLQIDPQVDALKRWKDQQRGVDLESAISRGGGRGGAVDWLAAQRQDRFGGELQRLEASRGDVTAQMLAQLQAQEHSRGMEGHQAQLAAMQQLAQMAQAHDMEQWQRALSTHDRTMLTPMQQHQLNLGYGDLIGEIPGFMVDPYGAKQTSAPAGGTSAPAQQQTTTYKIQPGDTLWRLAQRFNTTVEELAKLNNISNPNLIIAGANLKVPA